MKLRSIILCILTTLLFACTQKRGGEVIETTEVCDTTKTYVMSDDGLVTVHWWDTGDGGTAPQIESVCQFKTESGQIKEISTPLLSVIHPDEDYGHHEVEKIISLETEFGKSIYFFYLRAKVGSNEFAHDLISLTIEGDSLVPINIMNAADKDTSHISLNFGL